MPAPPPRAGGPLRVLHVEDDPSLRAAARAALSAAGFVVVSAENGQVALALAGDAPPDVIVLDSRMPVLDGVGFARAYRSTPPPHAPIVAVSVRLDAHLFAAMAGASHILPKPYQDGDLVDAVRRAAAAPPSRPPMG